MRIPAGGATLSELQPDGKDKPGKTRNWPGNKRHVNLPWNAMSFVVGEKRYTAAYLDKPTNPKEARFSERDYGRFGSYFKYGLEPGKELDDVAGHSAQSISPPKATKQGTR